MMIAKTSSEGNSMILKEAQSDIEKNEMEIHTVKGV